MHQLHLYQLLLKKLREVEFVFQAHQLGQLEIDGLFLLMELNTPIQLRLMIWVLQSLT